jgi:hypothetical protein
MTTFDQNDYVQLVVKEQVPNQLVIKEKATKMTTAGSKRESLK